MRELLAKPQSYRLTRLRYDDSPLFNSIKHAWKKDRPRSLSLSLLQSFKF
jgi:hypothetical protein